MHIIDLRSDTSPNRPPRCARRWPRPRWATTSWGTTPPSSAWKSWPAARLGKEAGLFVASGTMGNLVSLLAQCGRGAEIILGDQAHTYIYEQGGMAAGRHPPALARNQPDGALDLDEVRSLIRVTTSTPAHPADHRGEHAQPLRRHAADRGLHAGAGRAGAGARPAGARGRRAHLQRRGGAGGGCQGAGGRRRLGDVLPEQGAGRAGRVGRVRQQGVHRGGAAGAQDRRRRDAAGGCDRGRGHRGAGADGGSVGRGSRQRTRPVRGIGRAARHRGRAGGGAHQHPVLPDHAARPGCAHPGGPPGRRGGAHAGPRPAPACVRCSTIT